MTTAVVVAGGLPPDVGISESLPAVSHVVAADSGLDHALALGLEPTLLVGDLDSISEAGLGWVHERGVEVRAHPVDKDETDLELAIAAAAEFAEKILVVDSGLGRLDHSLANLLLLASDRFSETEVTAFVGAGVVTVVRDTRSLSGEVGELVSLVAMGGRATGVTTEGLRWRLLGATVEPGSTWGVSNEFGATSAQVTVQTGVILAVQPRRPPAGLEH